MWFSSQRSRDRLVRRLAADGVEVRAAHRIAWASHPFDDSMRPSNRAFEKMVRSESFTLSGVGTPTAIAVTPWRRRRSPDGHRTHRVDTNEVRGKLGEVLKPGRAFRQVALEPAQRRPFVLRRAALGVQADKLERVLKREGSEARGRRPRPSTAPAFDRSAKADVRVRLGGHRTYVLRCGDCVSVDFAIGRSFLE
jgi:hypothetical protein